MNRQNALTHGYCVCALIIKLMLFSSTHSDLKDNEGETPLNKVLGYTYLDLREDLVDLSLSLVTRGCGSEKDKGNLLCVACYMSKLDVIKELVELHKVEPSGELIILYHSTL